MKATKTSRDTCWMTHFALSSNSSLTVGKPGASPEATAGRTRPRETHGEPSYPHGHGDVDSDADGATPHRSAGEPTSTNFRTPVLY